jgi:hypothetical protein
MLQRRFRGAAVLRHVGSRHAAVQQAVLDQPGGSAAPGIVCAHAKISLLVRDDGAGLSVADLKPHRVFHSADPRHDPDKGLLGAEFKAIAASQPSHFRSQCSFNDSASALLISTRLFWREKNGHVKRG